MARIIKVKSILSRIEIMAPIQVSSVILTAIILPIIVISTILRLIQDEIAFTAYRMKIELLFTPLLMIGIIITCFTVLIFFYEPYMLGRLIYSIIPEVIYIIQIVIFSLVLDVYFNLSSLFVRIDISKIYWSIILIPALIIVKNIYNFRYHQKKFTLYAVLLEAIRNLKSNAPTKKNIRKLLSERQDLSVDVKNNLLRNFSKILSTMEQEKKPLIKYTSATIRITKNGYKLLNHHDKFKMKSKITRKKELPEPENLQELEYWTEEELENLKKEK